MHGAQVMNPNALLGIWTIFAAWVVVASFATGCSGAKLKKCPSPFVDDSVLLCKENVQGVYRLCEKPSDLFRCEEPN